MELYYLVQRSPGGQISTQNNVEWNLSAWVFIPSV